MTKYGRFSYFRLANGSNISRIIPYREYSFANVVMESLISFWKENEISINGKKALLRILAFVEYVLTYKEYVNYNNIMCDFFNAIENLEGFLLDELIENEFQLLKSESGPLFRYKWLSSKYEGCTFPLKNKTKAYQLSKFLDYMFLKSIDDDRLCLMKVICIFLILK